MRTSRRIFAVLVLAFVSAGGIARANGKSPRRLAYVGLLRGPMAPARAEALESLLIDELDGYDTFRLVDAGGNALDERLLGYEASRAAKLIDEGVDHLLHFRHKKAIERLDKAIEVFETRLTSLHDQEILHDALLAKAEALDQSGRSAAALETLKELAALTPRKVPTRKTHPTKFVSLWERAQSEMGAPGRISVDADEPAPVILLDGKHLGSAPQTAAKVTPGKHYLVARWPFFVVLQTVQVSPGKEVRLTITREGPANKARENLLEVIAQRQGLENAQAVAKRIADLAGAEECLVAAVESQGGAQSLLVAKHDQEGKLDVVAKLPLPESIDTDSLSSAVRRLGAALFVDRQTGEVALSSNGEARTATGLTAALYGRGGGALLAQADPVHEDSAPPKHDEEPPSRVVPKLAESTVARTQEKDGVAGASGTAGTVGTVGTGGTVGTVEADAGKEDRPITKEWWFWAGAATAFVAVAVIGASLLLRPGPSSTTFEVNLR